MANMIKTDWDQINSAREHAEDSEAKMEKEKEERKLKAIAPAFIWTSWDMTSIISTRSP